MGALAVLTGLAAICATANTRLLLQAQQCSVTTSTWDYATCYAATGEAPPAPPPPPVQSSEGPEDDLPPRWASTAPTSAPGPAAEGIRNASSRGNPFVNPDASPPLVMAAQGSAISGARGGTLGFRTGGDQASLRPCFCRPPISDVENYRETVKRGYLPLPTDVSFDGIVKDYYFNNSRQGCCCLPNTSQPCAELFYPIYSLAAAPDPLRAASAARRRLLQANGSGPEPQLYMAVGLDSGLQAADFQRKRLDLVIVLDVSGSMGSPFDAFYYDEAGTQHNLTAAGKHQNATKIDVAKDVLNGILDLLAPNDSVAVVLFSDSACAPKPLGPASCLDIPSLQAQIARDVKDTASTSLSSGIDLATAQLQGCKECMAASLADVERRMVIITDEQPNSGDYTTEGLAARLRTNAAAGIFTTIIGVGLDFNTELADAISRVRGANYYSVHTPGEFQRRLSADFDFAVTPLVFDLALAVDQGSLGPDGWKVLQVYGSPNPNDTALIVNGTIIQINTLFPSPKTDQGIKGGVVLLRMRPPSSGNSPLKLTVTYSDRTGRRFSSQRTVMVPQQVLPASGASGTSYFDSTGVRKAVLLARYTDILHDWLLDQWAAVNASSKPIAVPADACTSLPADYCDVPVQLYGQQRIPGGCKLNSWLVPDACLLPAPFGVLEPLLGRWERQSQKLSLGSKERQAFEAFLPYFEAEEAAVGDPTLSQEVDLMRTILAA